MPLPIGQGHMSLRAAVAGFEPAYVSLTASRLTIGPHRTTDLHEGENTQRELNPHLRPGKAVRCRYVMGAGSVRSNGPPMSREDRSTFSRCRRRWTAREVFEGSKNPDRVVKEQCPTGGRNHRVGLEPTSPHYECGVFAARPPVPDVVLKSRAT